MANTLPDGIRAQPVELYSDSDTFPLGVPGKNFGVSCTIAATDTTAADSPLFSFKVNAGNFGVYVTEITGTLAMDGTTATAFNGLYFERYSGAAHSGGTDIVPVSFDFGENPGLSYCQFKVSALTATGVNYEGAKFGRTAAPQTNGSAVPIYVVLPRKGLYLPPGFGLAARLEYIATGLVLDLNINYTKAGVVTADGR